MMYITGFALALICTLCFCLTAILIKWVITSVGVTFFALVLILMSLIFLLIIGDKNED